MHTNERVFPEPFTFNPERWLNNKGLEKYLVSFTKGSRQCIGINLAHCEIYLTMAMLFRRWDMELYDVGDEDIVIAHDYFIGCTPLEGRKLKVILKARR
jgi:cytochrome P450